MSGHSIAELAKARKRMAMGMDQRKKVHRDDTRSWLQETQDSTRQNSSAPGAGQGQRSHGQSSRQYGVAGAVQGRVKLVPAASMMSLGQYRDE